MLKNMYKTVCTNFLEFGKTRYSCKQTPPHILNYLIISLILHFRDFFKPPKHILCEVGIKQDFVILDYGCGPGNYSIAASEMLEKTGVIFSLDKHPLAIKSISKKIKKKGIQNIEIIHSDCETGLASNSVDVILLHYVFNDLINPENVLKELYRIIKPTGILSFLEFDVEGISPNITKSKLFQLQKKMNTVHIFEKNNNYDNIFSNLYS